MERHGCGHRRLRSSASRGVPAPRGTGCAPASTARSRSATGRPTPSPAPSRRCCGCSRCGPGDQVLDVGAGSGWTTALLAHLTGPAGVGDRGGAGAGAGRAGARENLAPDGVRLGLDPPATPGVLGWPDGGAVRPDPGLGRGPVDAAAARRPAGRGGADRGAGPGHDDARASVAGASWRPASTGATGSCRCCEVGRLAPACVRGRRRSRSRDQARGPRTPV